VVKPLLKFKSFTQGLKAVSFIKNIKKYEDVEVLKKATSLANRNEIWVSGGRKLGEKAFLTFEKGKLTSYGFYELHTQINSAQKIDQLKIKIDSVSTDLQNDLKLALLREDYEILPLSENK
jgi:DNA polymerase-3 subunit epsilon